MKERPILFSAPMVRAILEGRKTQTRRILKPGKDRAMGVELAAHEIAGEINQGIYENSKYGEPGDRLWVRESWAAGACADKLSPSELHPGTWLKDNGGLWYPADGAVPHTPISPRGKGRPSIHIPRWASRINLDITALRVEKLQDITEEDARAEGVLYVPGHGEITQEELRADPGYSNYLNCRLGFRALWETLNGEASWRSNPWVYVIGFPRHEPKRCGVAA